MYTTKISQIITGLIFVRARKLTYSHIVLLPAMAFWSAMPAWNQSGVGASLNAPEAQQGQVPRLPPNLLSGPGPARLLRVPDNASTGALQAQVTTAIPPFANYSFVSINIANSTFVLPAGVNNAGLVAGYYQDASYNAHGFVWQNGSSQPLDYPGATATFLFNVNNRGVLIGYYNDASGTQHAVTYSVTSAAWSSLPDIPNYPYIVPGGINDRGEAVGYAGGSLGYLAWIWHSDSQSYSFFTVPGAREASTYPAGINNVAELIGEFGAWPTDTQLGFLRAGCRDGDYEDTDRHCYKQINVRASLYTTVPSGINNHGTIAGWFFDSNFDRYGFVRTPNGVFSSVNAPRSRAATTQVFGINDAGVICGTYATSSTGQAFIAYPQ